MIADLQISSVAEIIQIAIAPVFLLAAISALLMVMTNRLTRVIDRWRSLERASLTINDEADQLILKQEMKSLYARGRYTNLAITLATLSALLVCTVIVTLFLSSIIGKNAAITIAGLFIACISVLILALCSFLAEVLIASRTLRRGLYKVQSITHSQ